MKSNQWIKKALALGSVFFLAVLLVKPIGVSTQFSVLSGMLHSALDEAVIVTDADRSTGYRSTNAYYDKSEGKLAKSIQEPWSYDFVFVLTIPAGAFIAYSLNKKQKSHMSDAEPDIKQPKFLRRYLPSFLGGFIILFGARMADGCTSGHMMSGIMQGSVSGYLFAISVFAVAIPVSLWAAHRSIKGGIKQ